MAGTVDILQKNMQREAKKEIIAKHQTHKKDSGSAQVQISILTERIKDLTEHLKIHPKDDHSRRGLLLMVGKRRKLLNFLKKKSKESYEKIIGVLGLRH